MTPFISFHPDFFDQYGLLRPYRTTEYGNPETLDSLNGYLYTAFLVTLLRNTDSSIANMLVSRMYAKYTTIDTPIEKSNSHDEFTGLVCCDIKPTYLTYSRLLYRLELILYLYVNGYRFMAIFFPLLWMKLIWSCLFSYTAKNGVKETDGKLIAWVILERFNFPVKRLCYYLIRRHFGSNWLHNMFLLKFSRNLDNPCILLTEVNND